ncbi:phenylalanyl-tRNA synthetase subunit beta [Schleiferia thermophila str. Yellowstone]|jgi:phenylalanyl-tRNA synthetase beta chain|uniref:phenylalanine--tRNA ligase subunit beta n=1 Tax=Schleiferia thermophila TaxID=884107 RepID=UPI0004E653EB|nr:phenylalanine--tRNA ligase subunit beta [Schleiferia thermophila]KFD40134.1 phenylalanyl-tRNA synthetase subunit beta [Schleiferia thermophila str. Yellowstone]
MKISYNWLKEYIDLKNLNVNEVGEILTQIGLECEAIERLGGGPEIDPKVVVGYIVSAEKHPNADKLTLCQVDVGNGLLLQIVCGAPNVAAGQKVPVAQVGARLKTFSGEEIHIKKSKIRGAVSEGMICAEDELGLSHDHNGIMVLPDDTQVGLPLAGCIATDVDYILEIGLTPNRADAMSHYGVARDLYAYLTHKKKKTEINLPSVASFKVSNQQLTVDIEIDDRKACYRYAGVTVSGVKVGPSPQWLQQRLKAVGLTPINNIVDITNFVLHECGHPLHAFDADKITGRKIKIRKATEGEKFITLDGIERTLSADDLMICDADKPLVLAGIYGGLYSGVTGHTVNVFLESAVFDSVHIRRSARRHGLQTDASYRYERGVDPDMTLYALKRAAILIKELAGGEISMNIHDEYPTPIAPHPVDANLDRIRRFIGKKDISNAEIKSILASLEIKIAAEIEDTLRLEVPAYRVDVQREADIAEEILRIYGLDAIDPPRKIKFAWHTPVTDHQELLQKSQVARLLSARGLSECLNNSLTSPDHLPASQQDKAIALLNPLSRDLSVLRTSMLPPLLHTIRYNLNRQQHSLMLFEFGKIYHRTTPDSFSETDQLAIVLTGHWPEDTWMQPSTPITFYHLVDTVEAVLHQFKIHDITKSYTSDDLGEGIDISAHGQPIASLRAVAPTLLVNFEIDQPVYYAHLHWENLFHLSLRQKTTYKPIHPYPEVVRDLALLVDTSVTFKALTDAIASLRISQLRDIRLFDVYQGKNLPAGTKSYALRFILRSDSHTLQEHEIDHIMQRIFETLSSQCGARLR